MTPDQLSRELKELGISKHEFADRLGIHKGTISHWAKNPVVPSYIPYIVTLLHERAELTTKLNRLEREAENERARTRERRPATGMDRPHIAR